ncbi:MAG: Unknown protein, partial [uncultured Sulfurovum sp.]
TDFDYRDNHVEDDLTIDVSGLEKLEGDSGETEFIIPIKLNKVAPKGGVTIEYIASGDQVYKNDFADLQVAEFFAEDPNGSIGGSTANDTLEVPNPNAYHVHLHEIGTPEVIEGNEGETTTLEFEVELNKKAPVGGVTVQVSTKNLTATEGEDFTRNTSSVYFAPGEQVVNISYTINGDDTFEEDETFEVTIHDPINAVLHGSHTIVTGTILNDDEDQSTGIYDQSNTSYKRYYFFWSIFKYSYWKYSKYYSDKYSSYEEYYIKKLNKTPNEKYPLITRKSAKNQKTVSTNKPVNNKVAKQHKTDELVPLTIKIPEGETEGKISIYVQGDTSYESNEPFTLSLSTEDDATFINTDESKVSSTKSTRKRQRASFKSSSSKTNFNKGESNKKDIIVIIINDDRVPVAKIAEYRFDCLSRNKYQDYSSIGNHISTTLTSVKRPNSTIMCNAIDGYSVSGLTITDQAEYHEDNGTISFWMYDSGGVDSVEKAVSKGTFNIGFNPLTATTGNVQVQLADGTNINSTRVYNSANPEWIFVTVTYATGDKVKLYMDGVLEGEANYDGSFDNASNINVAAYSGYFDEFYMFDRDMSVDEINSLYAQQLSNTNLDGSPRDCACVDLGPTLVGEYRFDSCYWTGASGEVLDSSGYNQHLTALNGVQPQIDGKILNAPVFDFNQTQIQGTVDMPFSNEVTINTWIKTTENQAPGGEYVRLVELSRTGNFDYSTTLAYNTNGSSIRGWTTNEDNNRSATVTYDLGANGIHDGQWHMLTLTYSPGTISLYVDGDLKHTDATNIGDIADVKQINIGSYFNNNHHFNGSIDETLISDVALTATEIESIYTYTNDGKNWDGTDRNTSACSYSGISINDMAQREGDNGITKFDFTVSIDTAYPVNTSVSYVLHDGTATVADNDYIDDTQVITFLANDTTAQTISVDVVGDMTIEPNETFTVELVNPVLLTLTDGEGVGTIVNDDAPTFTIERNVIGDKYPPEKMLYEYKREFYTQLSNTDFDYSIVSYDSDQTLNKEYPLENVTLKVELYDQNSTNNDLLYQEYIYWDHNESRKKIDAANSYVNDLIIDRVTRNAQFQVSCLLDENGSLYYGDHRANFENTLTTNNLHNGRGYSDDFAIRPLAFDINITDTSTYGNSEYKSNRNNDKVSLASEYAYEIHTQAVKSPNALANYYKTISPKELNVTLSFDETNTTNCADSSDIDFINTGKFNKLFSNGQVSHDFSHYNVGNYHFEIQDINWTSTDKDKDENITLDGCIRNSVSNTLTNGMYGCNIGSNVNTDFNNVAIEFEAYEFNLTNTTLKNINDSGEKYVYMGDLNLSYQQMGVELFTDVIAQGKNHTKLTNFTDSCVAKNVPLNLNYMISTDSEDNVPSYSDILTREGTSQSFKRIILLNDINPSEAEVTHLDTEFNVPATAFLNTNEGNSSIRILYNVDKNLSETMNPIDVNFLTIDANATESEAKREGEDNIAVEADNTGIIADTIINGNSERKFYFTRVAPDMENYPESYDLNQSTPLSVEIFCDLNRTWCADMVPSSIGLNSKHTKYGWYTARNHVTPIDGTITQLVAQKHRDYVLDISPDITINPTDTNLSINRGRYADVMTSYNGNALNNDATASVGVTVIIRPSPWLRYHDDPTREGDPFYNVIYKNNNFGTISGIGQSGHGIDIQANDKEPKRLSW